jgi:hypothetical protein
LQKLRTEIKAHIKNVQNDTGKLAASVAKEREMSTKVISDLNRAIGNVNHTPMSVSAKEDPFAVNMAVLKQLQKQVAEENSLQKSIIIMQQNSAHFEEGIVRSIQSAWSTFDEWQSRMSTSVQDTWRQLGVNMSQLMPDREWISFAARSDHLLDPETPLRSPDHIDYPGKNDPSITPVHSGLLERKKRFTKSYKEGFYVLTPAGYLHEYASSDPSTATHPIWSLFLPACTLGPPSSATTAKSHKFHIEARKDGTSAHGKTPGGRGLFGGGDHAFTFRARSHEEMMEVWNDLRMLVARYLVASEQMERDGPVAHAVRSVGYNSQDEEDEEDEEEGSSIEEDEHDHEHIHDHEHEEDEEEMAHADGGADTEEVPAYNAATLGAPVEVGPNGYAVSNLQIITRPKLINRSRRRRSQRRMSPRLTPLPMLLVMMPLPSVSCRDERKRLPLVTESSPQLVRTILTLRPVKGSTKYPISARYQRLLHHILRCLPVKHQPRLPVRNTAKSVACFLDSPKPSESSRSPFTRLV